MAKESLTPGSSAGCKQRGRTDQGREMWISRKSDNETNGLPGRSARPDIHPTAYLPCRFSFFTASA